MTISKPQQSETPSHEHLEWLINSRARNQRSALSLHSLTEVHFEQIKKSLDNTKKSQILTAICFSLWRAAFLADKTGIRENTLNHVRAFLGKMLTDNAITYQQDRASREWTFNYYVNNARDNLQLLSRYWPDVEAMLLEKRKPKKGTSASGRRWDQYQDCLELALDDFRAELEVKAIAKKTNVRKNI